MPKLNENQRKEDEMLGSLFKWFKQKITEMSEISFQTFIFICFVTLELFIAVFLDTTIVFDAVSRVKGGLEYYAGELGLDFVQWLPFFKCGHIWLPLFQWLIGLIVVFPLQVTHVSLAQAYFVGEIISALVSAGVAIYVYRILRDFFELDRNHASLGFIFLLGHGYWIAYASQPLTEALSIFFLIGTSYHMSIFLNRESNVTHHLILASFLATLNNLLRYEPWALIGGTAVLIIGVKIWKMAQTRKIDNMSIEQITRLVNFLFLPLSICFLWLLYTFQVTGSFSGTTDWILAHNTDWGFVPLTKFNPIGTLVIFVCILTLVSIFWVLVPWLAFQAVKNPSWFENLRSKGRTFLFIQGVILGLFTALSCYLMYTGVSTSPVRHYLFVVPYIAITGAILYTKETNKGKRYLRYIIYASLLFSCIILISHHIYHFLLLQSSELIIP